MESSQDLIGVKKLKVKPGEPIRLEEFSTKYKGKTLTKSKAASLLELGIRHLAEMQEKLYAQNQYSVLIILQAMDASGKDSAVKHIMSGFNPMGVKVYSFKAPTPQELDHHYLWRHNLALPGRGEIAIHNRSHYENVLITRIHPELILKENLPGIDSIDDITKKFWQTRFKQINRFEKNISQNGTIILKFFLHLSKAEQKKRLLERIDDPEKHWKFDIGDLRERGHWEDYSEAYEEAINATSTARAPWYVIPADDKWYTRLAIAGAIYQQFQELNIDYPSVTDELRANLEKGKALLKAED